MCIFVKSKWTSPNFPLSDWAWLHHLLHLLQLWHFVCPSRTNEHTGSPWQINKCCLESKWVEVITMCMGISHQSHSEPHGFIDQLWCLSRGWYSGKNKLRCFYCAIRRLPDSSAHLALFCCLESHTTVCWEQINDKGTAHQFERHTNEGRSPYQHDTTEHCDSGTFHFDARYNAYENPRQMFCWVVRFETESLGSHHCTHFKAPKTIANYKNKMPGILVTNCT